MRSDEMLVEQAIGGDMSAFAEIVARYQDRIYRFCRASLGREDAEDTCQEIFILAHRNLPALADRARFKAWLFAIARNQIKKSAAERRETVPVDEIENSIGDSERPVSEELRVSSLARLVRELIEKLSDANRPVAEMYYLASLNAREISEALDISTDVVKSRLYEARKDIKARLIRGLRDALRRESAPSDLAGRIIDRCGSGCECGLIIPEKEGSQMADKKDAKQTKKQQTGKSCGCGCTGKK
ncbi:MAG: RNA polymerase sigma factor [Armatimonadota bacterium]|nr:RNA polymerase sigma factor [Armatimonadota bacterium]